jgi:hypothetical protein
VAVDARTDLERTKTLLTEGDVGEASAKQLESAAARPMP